MGGSRTDPRWWAALGCLWWVLCWALILWLCVLVLILPGAIEAGVDCVVGVALWLLR